MKIWKHFTVLAVLAIFGIIVGFTACADGNGDNDPTVPLELHGTWVYGTNGFSKFIFTSNSLTWNWGTLPTGEDQAFVLVDLSFSSIINTEADADNDIKTTYPSGYSITGKIKSTNIEGTTVGQIISSLNIYLNNTRDKLYAGKTNNFDNIIHEKQ